TKGFVVDWLYLATQDGSVGCPNGVNPLSEVFYRRILREMGYAPDKIENLLKDFPNGEYIPITTNRGRIDGKPVNVYANPTSVPDPHIITVTGKTAYGFNLDGKDSPDDFVHPASGEKGIDNQLYRALGCIQSHMAQPPLRPTYSHVLWDLSKD